jgi:tRNA uracil 4-sulfurtransferase
MDTVLVRYAEIATKGNNRIDFEKQLIRNIRAHLKANNHMGCKIVRVRGRILIRSKDAGNISLETIFGISSFSIAQSAESESESLKKEIIPFISGLSSLSRFRVSTVRIDKTYPGTSQEINRILGTEVCKKTNAKVDLEHFDLNLGIEIIDGDAYIFTKSIEGQGGLPLGIQGKVLCLIEDRNSILASLLIMKRGCSIVPLSHCDADISVLTKYFPSFGISMKKIQNLSSIEDLALKYKTNAIVVGDTISHITRYDLSLLILRPLIGYKREEIADLSTHFGI